ncbi:hypothetical protein MM239_04870 [Belliella sp. DSM 111904]|uniref:Chaperone of endosialidase n=1 Tax=Belliella filtrata TaxID=2923435 RepID=A0ABS9UX20_9BACT|nr:hypothetical protein [Belliella filtrata]MCH7408716.1 hypothetical protein [Belliella filtrata]
MKKFYSIIIIWLILFSSNYLYGQTNSFPTSGNVGIGTVSPSSKLDVKGGISVEGSNPITSVNNFRNSIQLIAPGHSAIVFNPGESTELMFGFHTNGNFYWGTGQNAGNNYLMTLNRLGDLRVYRNMGIGIAPISGFKLSVNGSIKTKEVNVTTSGWADHVFEKGYPLIGLEILESFINSNHHLPGIPTASEVENQGVNLGEMNVKLLEKVEELTLYTIDQEKKIKEQNKEINDLKSEIQEIRQLIEGKL